MDMQRLLDQLREDEGFRSYAYQDHLGYWTIGYGRLIDQRKGGGISRAEATTLLANDVNDRIRFLKGSLAFFDELDDVRKEALINMSFQLGTTGLMTFRRMLKALDEKKYNVAGAEALDSKWAGQTPRRAKRIARELVEGVKA